MKRAGMVSSSFLMLTTLHVFVASAGESGPAATPVPGRHPDRAISLHLRDAAVPDLLLLFMKIGGASFVVDPIPKGTAVSIDVTDLPWPQDLDQILKTTGLTRTVQDGIIHIGPAAAEAGAKKVVVLEARLFRGTREASPGVRSNPLLAGDSLTVIDADWADGVSRQSRDLEETFGLKDVRLLAERRSEVAPGATVSFAAREEDKEDYLIFLTPTPGEPDGAKVRIQGSVEVADQKFLGGDVVASAGKPFLLGGRDEKTGDYIFLSVTARMEGGRELSLSAIPRVTADMTPPKLDEKSEPVYPPALKEKKIEGEVVLDLFLGADGKVGDAKVLKSDHEELTKAALDAVRTWRYEPAKKDGQATAVRIVVRVRFVLR